MSFSQPHVGVVGAGAWGTALAVLANRAGSKVTLWARNQASAEAIAHARVNAAYLPDQFIDPAITITHQLADLKHCDGLVLAVPAQSLRSVLMPMSDYVASRTPLLIATKGIERGSVLLMSELVQLLLPQNPVAVISGPNFADEAASGKPTASVIASHNLNVAEQFSNMLSGRYFRIYTQDDPIGVQLCGALKNVIAIAAGISDGQKLGENARAAVITRGMAEMARLLQAKGGKITSLLGLAGAGDILLTCNSPHSRNFALGYAIGQAGDMAKISLKRSGVMEGVATAESAYHLARNLLIDAPIIHAVQEVLAGQSNVSETVLNLLQRPVGEA